MSSPTGPQGFFGLVGFATGLPAGFSSCGFGGRGGCPPLAMIHLPFVGPTWKLLTIVQFGLFQLGLYHPERAKGNRQMDKSIYTREYETLVRLLREAREGADLTQIELAELLGQSQSFVSKSERGERRLDLIQLRTICRILGISLVDFVNRLERELAMGRRSR